MPAHLQEVHCKCPCHYAGICLHVVPCCSGCYLPPINTLCRIVGLLRDKIRTSAQQKSEQFSSSRKELWA
jgi:hypothetical protein